MRNNPFAENHIEHEDEDEDEHEKIRATGDDFDQTDRNCRLAFTAAGEIS
jgi:hypothetical protein